MRALVPFVTSVAAALGCGDGVGRPILDDDSATHAAGSGGLAGGAVGTGGAGGAAGAAGAGQGGFSGFGARGAAFGGARWDGAPRGGGGWGGTTSDESCLGAERWPDDLAYSELGMLDFLNFLRGLGLACEEGATGVAVPTLVLVPELQCAARLHSRDMAERDFFDRVNPDGIGPEDRIRRTGYTFRVAAESIAREDEAGGGMVPYRAIEELLADGGSECENLVDPRFDAVGIGHFADLWTIDLAGP